MKIKSCKVYFIGVLLIAYLFLGCENPTSSSDSSDSSSSSDSVVLVELWPDSSDVKSDLKLDTTSKNISKISSRSVSDSTENKIYFRSSDIEFWSIDSISDINSIFSSKYSGIVDEKLGYADGKSLEYSLGDETESIVFTPYENNSQTLGNGLNPEWTTQTAEFLEAGLSKINLARLDIGDGSVSFIIEGEATQVLQSNKESSCPITIEEVEEALNAGDISTEEYDEWIDWINTYTGSGIDANSIFFVDNEFLSEPVLIPSSMEDYLINNEVSASDYGITDSEFEILQTIVKNNNSNDDVTMIDVNGALFIPLDPVDLSSFEPNTNTLQIEIGWEIAGAVQKEDEVYFMDNRVEMTAFDFTVNITVQ